MDIEFDFNYGVSHDKTGYMYDWKLQFGKVKPLIVSGPDETLRADLVSKFGRNHFENMMFTNLKNNAQIREYINEHEPGRDMMFFLEKALSDMIVPLDSMLIFNNAHTCEGIWKLIRYLYETESQIFVAITGEFTNEQLAAAKDYSMILML